MRLLTILATLSGVLMLGGCVVGSDYRKPDLQLPSTWQAPQSGKLAGINSWWARFDDPALNALLQAAQKDNPTLAKATAAIEKARASRSSAEASFWPSLNVSADASASGSLKNGSSSKSTSSGFDAAWELDLFGKTRRSVESSTALIEAREADWHDARVSLAAEVASNYVDYCAARIKQKYYEDQAASQTKTSELTQLSFKAGFTAEADARLAEASAASTRSTALAQKSESELLVKTLVALTGMSEQALRQILTEDKSSLPQPEGLLVTAVPADILRQRPDIVSAERTLASTNALIGVAEAGRWPTLTLSGTISLLATHAAAMTAPWSFAPALAMPIFDGGSTTASIKSAKADYNSALASYRQTVRDAVKEVEQALVRLDSVAQREGEARKSAQGYRAYLTAIEQNWRVGGANLLDLETARRSMISAEVSLLELQQNRLLYWIALYKAVGGGWQADKGEKSESKNP
ncbi:MAG: efflux transporter outer membrane subunit [Geobacteraceae bacterium]|nr:efflux transporter outer membrane subunit [Geobacteraceae bacterium]